jgi:surfeit locus 1 family protein
LIARVAERPTLAALDLTATGLAEIGDPAAFLESNEYRAALLSGEYLPAGEVLVFTSLDEPKGPLRGPGYWVLTPFHSSVSDIPVYVNRGFVPQEKQADYAPPPSEDVTIRGLIRAPELGSWFTPDPDLKKRIFYARDVSRIARETGLGLQAGFFIDLLASETPPGGLPQAGETRMIFPNDHLQYAITWYGLAAALLAVFSVFAWRRLNDRADKAA